MKITALKTHLVQLPFEKPIKTAIHNMRSVNCVAVQLLTDEGLQGESYLFTLNPNRLKPFHEMVLSFEDLIVGRDPFFVEELWTTIWSEINPSGHQGVTISALSTIDTACWDLIGKALNRPLHHIFGACRDKIWTYASGGLWLSTTIDDLQREADAFIQEGFRSMKIRVGNLEIPKDVERVRAVREAVGPEIQLMCDANQSFTAKQAIQLGRQLEEFDIFWFEEPVKAYDLAGHAEVRKRLDLNVASGETEYTRFGMKAYLDSKACDILMPDLQRIGGLSEMRKTAALASAYNIPISTHIFTEHSLPIAGSSPNCISVEHMPWFVNLFNEKMELKDGYLTIPNRPGCGFTLNPEVLDKNRLS